MTAYSRGTLPSQLWISLLFHVWFCHFLTCIQVSQKADKVFRYYHLFKNFPQFVVIHTVKGFSTVNEAQVDSFLEFSWFFYDPTDVSSLISVSSAFSKSSLNIWKFSVNILLKPNLENFKHYLASMWNECNCAVVWTFFVVSLLWDWNESWPFTSPVATVFFQICWHVEYSTLTTFLETELTSVF